MTYDHEDCGIDGNGNPCMHCIIEERDLLRNALMTYGQHTGSCKKIVLERSGWGWKLAHDQKCTCGLSEIKERYYKR